MINKKLLGTLAITSLVATSFAFAQSGSVNVEANVNVDTGNMPPPPGERRGFFGKIFGGEGQERREERREDRKEIRGEVREDMKEARGEFREGMKERREWNMQNASGTATGTKPTPWKNLKEDMKDIKKEFRGDMKDMMKNMPVLNATQTAAIAVKLGITVDALNAQLASGTKLKEIIKDKIKPEEMKLILPPRMATFTKVMQEGGFFSRIQAQVFGDSKVVMEQNVNAYGEVTISTTTISVPATPFWKRFFNF